MYTFSVTIRNPLRAAERVVQVTAEHYVLGDGNLFFYSHNEDRPFATFAAGTWVQVVRDTDINQILVEVCCDEQAISELAARVSERVEQVIQDELA